MTTMRLDSLHHRNLFAVLTTLNGAVAAIGDLEGRLAADPIFASNLIGSAAASAAMLSGVTEAEKTGDIARVVRLAFSKAMKVAQPTDDVSVFKWVVTNALDDVLALETSSTVH